MAEEKWRVPLHLQVYLHAFNVGMERGTDPERRKAATVLFDGLGPRRHPGSNRKGASTLGDLIREAIDHRMRGEEGDT